MTNHQSASLAYIFLILGLDETQNSVLLSSDSKYFI